MVGGWRLREEGKRTTIPPGDPRSGHADQFLQSLKKAASGHPPAAFAYGNADLPALVRAGTGDRAEAAVRVGRDLLRDGLGTAPDESLAWPVDGAVDGALLQTLEQTRQRRGRARPAAPPGAADHGHPERHRRPGRRARPAAGPGRRRRAVGGPGRPAGGQRAGRVGPAHPGRDRRGLAGAAQLDRPEGRPARPAAELAADRDVLPVAGPGPRRGAPGCGSSRPAPWPTTSPRGRRRASASWPR